MSATPGKGAKIIYPNAQRAPAGYKYNGNYDPENGGWKIYGKGQVSKDRKKSIAPDANTVVNRFTGRWRRSAWGRSRGQIAA